MGKIKKVTLKSSDNQMYETSKEVAERSAMVTAVLEEVDDAEPVVPIQNVRGDILSRVIEFCKYHVDAEGPDGKKKSEDDVKQWDQNFIKVEQSVLFELILAANYMNIKDLLDLGCQTVADMIKGKTPEEIRKTFGIKNDFTPQEEEEVRRENQWSFE
ncbi:unnamed protein product [Pedinophyceae sp. YPF-701]|nr:unnamed protein product [Pedinophyceae sp. YPF-701]